MKIAFHILTFVVCAVAAYFSLSHRELFINQQSVRLETISTNKTVSSRADGVDVEANEKQNALTAIETEAATAAAALESATASGRSLTSQLAEIGSTVEGQETEIARLNESISEVSKIFQEFGENVTPSTVEETIVNLQRERDELVQSRDEMEELTAAAIRNLEEKRAEAARVTERINARNAQLSLNAAEAVISAVNHEWGFVLIGAGSNSGFSPQTSLIVQREGRIIGRVRPSSIEPTQTVAEIDYTSIPVGMRFQPGDRVMLANPVAN